MVVSCHLRSNSYNLSQCPPIVSTCCEQLVAMLDDDTSVVLKAVCEALQQCLPFLVSSTRPEIGIISIHFICYYSVLNYTVC